MSFGELVTSGKKQIWKKYIYLSVPTAFVRVGRCSGKKTVDSGELKNREAPVLNMTNVGKCCRKKSRKK
jgi:hypothetical protein